MEIFGKLLHETCGRRLRIGFHEQLPSSNGPGDGGVQGNGTDQLYPGPGVIAGSDKSKQPLARIFQFQDQVSLNHTDARRAFLFSIQEAGIFVIICNMDLSGVI